MKTFGDPSPSPSDARVLRLKAAGLRVTRLGRVLCSLWKHDTSIFPVVHDQDVPHVPPYPTLYHGKRIVEFSPSTLRLYCAYMESMPSGGPVFAALALWSNGVSDSSNQRKTKLSQRRCIFIHGEFILSSRARPLPGAHGFVMIRICNRRKKTGATCR